MDKNCGGGKVKMKALFINGSPNKNGIQQFLQRIYSEIKVEKE